MQISKKGINKEIEKGIFKSLYQVLADLKKPKQIENFLVDVLSDTERIVVAKRLAIATYLNKGKSYELIRQDLRVSSATIANVQKWLEQSGEGLNLALKAVEADEWADEMAEKVTASLKKMFGKK